MPIKGLHSSGQVNPGLARAGVIRLGYKAKKCKCGRITAPTDLGPTCPACDQPLPDTSFPRESSHFVLTDAPELADILGPAPTELNIYFPFDEVDRVFPSYMQLWAASALQCRGDGEQILYAINPQTGRATVKDGVALETFTESRQTYEPGQTMACPGLSRDLYKKCANCKPNAMLIIMLRDVPRLAYYQISTTSIHNIADLTRQLEYVRQQVAKLTGQPRIAGVPFILRRVERTISVPKTNRQGQQTGRQRVKKYLLELEIEPEWITRMVRGISRLSDPLAGRQALPAEALPVEPMSAQHFAQPPQWEPRPDDDPGDNNDIVDSEATTLPPSEETEGAKIRPRLSPDKLKEVLHRKIEASIYRDPETGDLLPIQYHHFGSNTAGLVSAKLRSALVAAPNDAYRPTLEWLVGADSASNISAAAADALLDWLLNGGKGDKFAAQVRPPAQEEAEAVYQVTNPDSEQSTFDDLFPPQED